MSKAYQTHTIEVELPNPEGGDLRAYVALIGTMQFFNKINLTGEERLRVINTLAAYHDMTPDYTGEKQ